jgi:UDP-N-acetylmuramate dehydrogenase
MLLLAVTKYSESTDLCSTIHTIVLRADPLPKVAAKSYTEPVEIKVQKNVDLKRFTTYKVGGPAQFFADAKNWQTMLGLREFARQNNLPYLILGGGSNVLFADEGYPGLVIHNKMDQITFRDNVVIAEGGVNLMKLLLLAGQNNLGGVSGLANVPGSVGGAVYGNAGIPGIWIGDIMIGATILPNSGNKPEIVKPHYFKFGYRDSFIKKTKDIVLSATLKMQPMPAMLVRKEIEGFIKERTLKQPSGNSCGSFFKNPGTFPSAGWLIEQAGCKGMTVGGARVSEKHANFMMNTGEATTADILKLTQKVHGMVKEKFDVNLEPEVQIYPVNPFK